MTLAHVFMMLVYCQPGQATCRVESGHATYAVLEECVMAAPAWVSKINRFDKRKVAGAFCELARRVPKPYTITRRELHLATCGQKESTCGRGSQSQTYPAEDP